MEFAKEQLNKHGWKEGAGLGREENGIKEAIKVKIKNDTRGVGHDAGAEFTLHWWDHAFNKAASNIHVETTDSGVSLKKKDPSSQASKKARTYNNKSLLYSQFVKGATLSDGNYRQEQKADKEIDSEDEQTAQSCLVSSNEAEIFRVCGGRTAHKGARHGHKMDAKLLRIQKQEAEHLANQNSFVKQVANQNPLQNGDINPSTNHIAVNEDSNSNTGSFESVSEPKRKKKKKRDKQNLEEKTEDKNVLERCEQTEILSNKADEMCDDNTEVKKVKKSKKRRKEKNENTETNVENSDKIAVCDSIDIEEPVLKKSKKKRKQKEDIETKINNSDEIETCDNVGSEEVVLDKKKKKLKIANSEMEEKCPTEEVECSKKKKKSKNKDKEH